MAPLGSGLIFTYEMIGTALLVLLGCGSVACACLISSKGRGEWTGGTWLLIAFGWGLGLYAGVYAAYPSGAHLNPAVTLAQVIIGATPVTLAPAYVGGQLVGAFLGALVCWAAYRRHFAAEPEAAAKLGVFATGPAIASPIDNAVTEAVGTFVLVFGILVAGGVPAAVGPLYVALLLVGIGAGLGGPTGFALNPARDLMPRLAHQLLPIPGKGGSNWGYAWVPIVAPLVGAALAAGLFLALDAELTLQAAREAARRALLDALT